MTAGSPWREGAIRTRRVCDCPGYGAREQFSIEHLFTDTLFGPGRTFGPWYCDACGNSFEGRITEDHRVEWRPREGDKKIATLDLLELKLEPGERCFVLVEGMDFEHDGQRQTAEEYDHGNRYDFHATSKVIVVSTRTLPRGIPAIDEDPHGLLRFVASRQLPPGTAIRDAADALLERDDGFAPLLRGALDGTLRYGEDTPPADLFADDVTLAAPHALVGSTQAIEVPTHRAPRRGDYVRVGDYTTRIIGGTIAVDPPVPDVGPEIAL